VDKIVFRFRWKAGGHKTKRQAIVYGGKRRNGGQKYWKADKTLADRQAGVRT
jgi:hypothetical protein